MALALALWGMNGCGEEKPEELYAAAETAAADPAQHAQAVQQFTAFLERFPQHEQAPKALKQLAMIAQQQGEQRETVVFHRFLP